LETEVAKETIKQKLGSRRRKGSKTANKIKSKFRRLPVIYIWINFFSESGFVFISSNIVLKNQKMS
jgi:hypothetical protein